MSKELFTDVVLPHGQNASIYEATGKDLFKAMTYSEGDTGKMIKSLMMSTVKIENKFVTENQLDNMRIQDVAYLSSVISAMINQPDISF